MKVLILGGSGFIGINLTARLLKNKNFKITIVDNFFRGKKDSSLKTLLKNKNLKLIEGDLANSETFNNFENDYDQVYVLASIVGVKYTEEIPDQLFRINTSIILNCLEWLKNSKCKKVLFTSTSECYAGTIDTWKYKVPTPETVPLCITDIKNPRFTYAVTKILGESGFFQYSKIYGFEITIIRYHNVYGPRMGFKHVIPQVTQRFFNGEQDFKIYGHNQTRSFNFISDAISGTIGAMESNNTNGEIINIGDMRSEIPIRELVKYIGQLLGYEGKYVNVAAPIGSVSRRCPDTSLANELFGYKPQVNWEQGVRETVNWYVNYLKSGGKIFE